LLSAFLEVRDVFRIPPLVCILQTFLSYRAYDYHVHTVHEEESSPLLCGFTATLFGSMPLAYEDSVKVLLQRCLARCPWRMKTP